MSTTTSELASIVVRCMECGQLHSATQPLTQCEACEGLLDIELDFPHQIDPSGFGQNLTPVKRFSGVWRYQSMLPTLPDSAIVSRSEGRTPLYDDRRLADYAGIGQLWIKHEGHNPTASFKDRGMTVGVSHAKAVGATIVACASTGNTSASLASYAAAGGMASLVLIPEGKIAGGKLAQTIAHNARIVQVRGDFDVALDLLRQLTAKWPVYLVNSVNPFRIEGQKTIVLEMLEQLEWQPPDYIVLPGGNLGNTAAFGKALDDAYRAGLIQQVPRVVTVQAEGAAPFYHYFASGWDTFEPVVAETVATAIKIGSPASVARAQRTIVRTGGLVEIASDPEIMDAKALIDAVGIGCEPASAASLAGLKRLVAAGQIPADASAVAVLTGHLLKDTEAIIRYHLEEGEADGNRNRPVTIDASLDALERTLADALQG